VSRVVEQRTTALRWYQTHDLDMVTHMTLQQAWTVTTLGVDDVPTSQETEWRSVPVVDGLRI